MLTTAAFLSPVLISFYSLAAISIWLGLLSLRGGLRFVQYLQTELTTEYPDFTPPATIFVPCRGVDIGLKANILALFAQDYPSFEVIFVCDSADDPALEVIESARQSFKAESGPTMRIVISGAAIDSGQKVHNLRAAIAEADLASDVFVFVDTDARPGKSWLRSLIAPLQNERLGATTGYRWFVPMRGKFFSHLRAVWNAAIASALGANEERNFCWGGATAIRRQKFEELSVEDRWRGTVSDDFVMTRTLHQESLPIKFVPYCLTPSYEDCSFRELLEFTTRQMKITRTYAAHLWKSVLVGSIIFVLTVAGAIVLIISRAVMGLSIGPLILLLLIILLLGAMKSHLRLRVVSLYIPDRQMQKMTTTLAHITLWPLASFLFLVNSLAAAGSRRVEWRGLTYELKSPTETVIIRNQREEFRQPSQDRSFDK